MYDPFNECASFEAPFLRIRAVNAVEKLGNGYDAYAEGLVFSAGNELFEGAVTALNGNKNTRVEDYAHLLFSGSRG